MALTAAEVIPRITSAFERRSLPQGAPIFQSHSPDVDRQEIERLARRTTWIHFPHDVLCDNPLALAFMTPEAFAWLLPAYLIVSVTLHSECRELTTSLITCLTPPDDTDAAQFDELADDMAALDVEVDEGAGGSLGADDELLQLLMARAAVLTLDERGAVREYLEHMDAAHGADFPVFGPKQALDRYWRDVSAGA